MAIYHCHISPVSRSEGRSSVAAASYRAADKLLDERTGITSDYTRKKGVEHSEIVLPKGVDVEWALDRQMLWNAAELSEKRKDSRVAREVEISLPHELNEQERLTLTRDFSQYLADQYKVAVDFAIHKPHDRSDERNFHAHILMTTREISEQGLTEKSVFEKDMRWLLANNLPTARMQYQAVREQWANFANKALEEKGLNIRIDHRSFEDQGIALAPTQHVGVQASRMQERGVDTERQRLDPQDAKHNAQLIQEHPEEIFKVITAQKSVFTQHDLAKAVHRYTDSLADYQACLAKVMAAPQLVQLQPENGKQLAVYSTHEQVALEQDLIKKVQGLAEQLTHEVDADKVDQAIAHHDQAIRKITGNVGLADEQKIAIQAATSPERIAVIEGLAGAGKSTLLAAAKEAWQAAGYQVVGAALSGKAAEGLEESSGISSRTLASWEYSIKNGRDRLDDKTVFVIDEAGMVASRQLARFIDRIEQTGGKIVLVGDSEQLQPINAGAPFRAIVERIQTTGLIGIRRQKVDWQRQASVDFAQQRTGQALAAYAEQDRIHFQPGEPATREALVRDYLQDVAQNADGSRLVLAHRRRDVYQLNQDIRAALMDKGHLERQEEQTYDTHQGKRAFAPGDRFIFLENDRGLDVKNGLLGEVHRVRRNHILVKVEGRKEVVIVPTQEYTAFDHGYATTIHKSQGATVDKTFTFASPTMDRHLTYVAMTRHKLDAQLYVNQHELPDLKALTVPLSRGGGKATTLDYQAKVNIDLPTRSGLVPPGHYENALNNYAHAHQSVCEQQALGLPLLESQKEHLSKARELLEQVRPGVAELLDKVLSSDATAQEITAKLTGHARAQGLVQSMQQWQDGGLQGEKASVAKPVVQATMSQRETDPVKPKPLKHLSEKELATYRFARAVHSIHEQESQGLPVLGIQKQEYSTAMQSLEAVQPGLKDVVLTVINSDTKMRERVMAASNHDQVRALVSDIDKALSRLKQQRAKPLSVRDRAIARAREIWDKTIPLEGSVAKQYLEKVRGINAKLNTGDVRFMPTFEEHYVDAQGNRQVAYSAALVVAARDSNKQITGVQQIHLDPTTAEKHPEVREAKPTVGSLTGSAVLIHAGYSNEIIFAEGVETGASVAQARPQATVYVSLERSQNYPQLAYLARKHKTDTVVFAADNDGGFGRNVYKSLKEAAEGLDQEGIKVRIATPPMLPGRDKTDFNDVLLERGEKAVNQQFNYARELDVGRQKERDHSMER